MFLVSTNFSRPQWLPCVSHVFLIILYPIINIITPIVEHIIIPCFTSLIVHHFPVPDPPAERHQLQQEDQDEGMVNALQASG